MTFCRCLIRQFRDWWDKFSEGEKSIFLVGSAVAMLVLGCLFKLLWP